MVLMVALATGCSDDAGDATDPVIVTVPAGEEFGVTYPDDTTLPATFVLRDDGDTALCLLQPALAGGEPSAEPIDSDEYGRPPAARRVDDGTELRFAMPSDVDPGRYRLCADDDTCIDLQVE